MGSILSPSLRRSVILCQVSKISLPKIPFSVSILKMTRSQSIFVFGGKIPSSDIVAPFCAFLSWSVSALGIPDISIPTVKLRPRVASAMVVLDTLMVWVAPIFLARLSRYSFTSVITTFFAPACLATATAIIPMGPAPVIRTS